MAGMRGNGNGQRGSVERPGVAMTRAESDALTPQKQVEILFKKSAERLDKMVPAHLKAERLWRLALAAMARDPKLTEATAQSILLSTMQCAALGLEPSTALQQAYLVPFNNKKKWKEGNVWREEWVTEAQLIIGYRGFILLAEQASVVSGIKAAVVHKLDDYFPALEGGEFRHIPYQDGDPGPLRAAYTRWIASNGQKEYWPMSRFELDKERDRFAKRDYRTKEIKQGQPWVTDFEAMCMKTTVRRAARFWPMQSERAEKLRSALALDERADDGVADYKTGLTDEMQGALHEIPETRPYIDAEPDYPIPDDGGAAPPALPERREDLIRMAIDFAHERRVSLPKAPGEMTDDDLRSFITEQ